MVNIITNPTQDTATEPTPEISRGSGDAVKTVKPIDPLIPIVSTIRSETSETGPNYIKRRFMVLGAPILVAAGVGAALVSARSEEGKKPIETVKTTLAIPDEPGEGVQSLVEEEADASKVSIDWETTQKYVEQARELNDGEPRLNEPYALVDIPNAQTAPVSPTTTAP